VTHAGYRSVVIVVSDSDTSIRDYYERDRAGDQFRQLHISYAVQPIPAGRTKPLGTADALLRALESTPAWKGQSFTVCNSDNLYSRTALRLLLEDGHEHALIDYDRAALEFNQKRIEQFAVTKKDPQGFLLDIIEKPAEEEIRGAADRHGRIGVSMNIFKFSYDSILPYLESVPLHPLREKRSFPLQ